jgi:hypothetical protein
MPFPPPRQYDTGHSQRVGVVTNNGNSAAIYALVVYGRSPMIELVQCLARPLQIIGDGLELRRLRQRLPSVHRRLVATPQGIRRESDAAYLERLRDIFDERYGIREASHGAADD